MTKHLSSVFFDQHVRRRALPRNTVTKPMNQIWMHIEERVAAIVVMVAIRSNRQKVLRGKKRVKG